jgi:hypothetical protein
MKPKILIIIVGIYFFPSSAYPEEGAAFFKAKCETCHVTTQPEDISTLVAPPIMAVMRHVKIKYVNKEDAVKFIIEYTLNPQASKAVCKSQKIKHFGLMPSQKSNVTKSELQTIASWMYDNFLPKGFYNKGKRKGYNGQTRKGK